MIYDEFTLGTTNNLITFNDSESATYYIRATKRFASNREIRQFDSNVPDEMGIVDFQTLVGREYYVIEGKIYPVGGDQYFYSGLEAMRKVCNPKISQDDADSDNGYVFLKWTDSVPKQLRVKPLYIDLPETSRGAQTPKFKIMLKVRYPFTESQTSNSLTLTPTTTGQSGVVIDGTNGLNIPTAGVAIGADTGSASGTATNNGDYQAYPTIIFTGPLNVPRITNSTLGKYIEFNYNLSSGTITITNDYDGVTAVASDGTNMLQYLTAGSDLSGFFLREGQNALSLTATTLGASSSCQISWRDTWPLS